MAHSETDLNPVSHITVDALGSPGRRVFYLQGRGEADTAMVTVIIEKLHLQNLIPGIEEVLTEIARQQPGRETPLEAYAGETMHIQPPVDPLFRAGNLGLGYHAESDRVVVFAQEILQEGQQEEAAAMIRFWCTRQQVRRLADWGRQVLLQGRKVCPQCGEPMDPAGHFCPKKNGRNRH